MNYKVVMSVFHLQDISTDLFKFGESLMKFSQAISWVRWFSFLETNVSKTISALVLRVELMWVGWTTQSFYLYLSKLHSQGCPSATGDLGAASLPA
jgi:hypothetical protein